ncbi:concanavalin A-like lectin/glucanase domain-containing protein [Mycena floridula]|nr:concanavalin A-like lectin/glucanase domain-containing protein [Mycena floridula]
MEFDPNSLYSESDNSHSQHGHRDSLTGPKPEFASSPRHDSFGSTNSLRGARPPPSSFQYPFQAYPGNPDPLLPRQSSRRSSIESIRSPTSPIVNNVFRNSVGTGSDPQVHLSEGLPRTTSVTSFRAPFLSPASRASLSRPNSAIWNPPTYPNLESEGGASSPVLPQKPPVASTRLPQKLTKDDKPWLARKQPRDRWAWWLTVLFIFLGVAGSAVICWDAYNQTSELMLPGKAGKLCSVLDGPLNMDNWNSPIYTNSDDNAKIQNNQLYIIPTLTSDEIGSDKLTNGYTYVVQGCSNSTSTTKTTLVDNSFQLLPVASATNTNSNTNSNSASATGTSSGSSAAPSATAAPAPASRLQGSHSVRPPRIVLSVPSFLQSNLPVSRQRGNSALTAQREARFEIRAKLGRGDWLLNRIRLLPESDSAAPGDGKYGAWPLSGEIDLLGARTNSPDYEGQGSNFILSSLIYGPFAGRAGTGGDQGIIQAQLLTKTIGWVEKKREGFNLDFHTYTLEWTPKFMRFYVDSRLQASLFVKTTKSKESFFSRGKYPVTNINATTGTEEVVNNPYKDAPNNAPFDQKFYLEMDIGAGGTAGWFQDNVGNKPWVDGSEKAMSDFAAAQPSWSSTWPSTLDDKAFRIDSVKMWQVC